MSTTKNMVLMEDLGFMDPELDALIAQFEKYAPELAPEDRRKITGLLNSKSVKRATIIAALATMGFTGAMQVTESFSSLPQTSSSDTKHVENVQKTEKTDAKVLGEVVYSPESKFGVKGEDFKTSSGHKKIGTLYQSQSDKVKYSAIRPVLMKEGMVVSTSEVKDNQFKESVTYKAADQKVYAPDKGKVFKVSKDGLVIEHQKGNVTYYSVMNGIAPADSIKEGQKIDQATLLGSSSELDYSVAMNYDSKAKEFYEFVHPNEFVDIEKSDNFRYATGEYKAKSEPVIKAKSSSLQKELEGELAELPKEVKESVVARGLVIENKQQMAALKGNIDFYREGNLPMQYIENGKAKVSPQVEALRPMLMAELKKKGLERFCDFLLAKTQQESGGDKKILSADPMQSSQSKNEIPDSITDPKESIEYGVAHFENMMKLNNMFDPLAYGDVRQAIHSYNFGPRVSVNAKKEGIPYSLEFMKEQSSSLAKEYYQKTGMERFKPNHDWRGAAAYGDVTYVAKIFSFFEPSKDWEERSESAIKEAHQKLEEKEKQEKVVQTPAPVEKKEEVKKSAPVEKQEKAVQKPVKGNVDVKDEEKIKNIPSDFKTTTLAELPESKNLEGVIIAVDAGHGKKPNAGPKTFDTGAVALDGHHEADDVKATADFAEEYFKKQGATVIRVRKNSDDFVPVTERGRIFNRENVHMAFSFHENSAETASANRSEVLFPAKSSDSKRLAEIMNGFVQTALPKVDKGHAVPRSDLGMFNTSERPTVIVEPYFISNPYGNEISKTDNVRKSVALTAVYSAYEFLGKELPKEEVKKEASKEKTPKASEEKTQENKSETKQTPKEEKKSSGVTEDIENFISNVFKKDKEKEEPKKEEPKKEEPAKQEDSKKEDTSKEEPKKEDSKKEDSKKEETKEEDSKKEDSKKEDSKKEETKEEDSKKEDSKKEDSKKEEIKEEDSKKEETKEEDSKKEESKKESGGDKKEESKKEEPKAVSMNTNDNVVHYDFVNKKQVATASPKEESTKNETKESSDDVSFVWDFVQKNRTRV